MNTSLKKYNSFSFFTIIIVMLISGLFTSCFGPKNLVTQQKQQSKYEFIGDTISGWALTRNDHSWGFVGDDGKSVIEPKFSWATDFSEGMALVKDKNAYRFVNFKGKQLRRPKALKAYSFSEGLAAVQIKHRWGYIDKKGKLIIKPQFDWAKPFRENRAMVSISRRKGFINKQGELIIPAIYEEAHDFENGLSIVRKDFKFGLIDSLGNTVLPNKFHELFPWEDDFYRSVVSTDITKRYGLIDADGKILLDAIYNAIDLFNRINIRVKKDGLYGLYDLEGREIIAPQYEELILLPLKNLIAAKKDEHWGFLDMKGQILLPFEKQLPLSVNENRIWIQRDSLYLLYNYNFELIQSFNKYNNVYPFSNGYAVVSVKDSNNYWGNLYGYIDRNGHEVVAPQFDGGAGNVNVYGMSVVGVKSYDINRHRLFNIKEGKLVDTKEYSNLEQFGSIWFNSYGDFIDSKTGKSIKNFPYQSLQRLIGERTDLAIVRRDGKAGLIDTSLMEVMPLVFDYIETSYNNDLLKLRKNGRWGFTDEKYRIRIPMQYDDVYYFQNKHLTEVKKDEKLGVINRFDQEIIPLKYTDISFDPSSDRIYAKKEDGIDIYDKEGRLLHTTDYEYLGFYGSNSYAIFRHEGKTGILGYDFDVIHEAEFDLLENFINGFAKVRKNGREFYINTKGEEVQLTAEQLKEWNDARERRDSLWIDFSS